jgi:flagellar biosynthesis/type III secretory pathway M-ring protein FliF/YscJ
MAARKQLFHPDEVKQKIKTSQLINRLQENALSKKETLTRGQIDSIKTLLAKTVPDLKAIEHTGKDGGPVAVTFSWLPPQS